MLSEQWGGILSALVRGALSLTSGFRLPIHTPANRTACQKPTNLLTSGFLKASAALGLQAGYVAMFAHKGRVIFAEPSGYADIEHNRPMRLDTHFRIDSMTKPVTAVAALALIEDGVINLDDPVSAYIPAARNLQFALSKNHGYSGEIPTRFLSDPLTIRHLLTFTSGIGHEEDDDTDLGRIWQEYDIYPGEGTLADRIDRMFEAPLYERPGHTWRYGWSADVLSRVIEVASGQSFDTFIKQRIFDPLGMTATRHLPPKEHREELATMYTQDSRRRLVPASDHHSDRPEWSRGGGGLVSTAGDYMRFALMLGNKGAYNGERILSPESVVLMTHPHVTEGVLADENIKGMGWGFGLAVVKDARLTPTFDRTGDFWWSGFRGTHFFVSPKTELAGVLLTQNQPGPYSPRPYPVHLAKAFAYLGR